MMYLLSILLCAAVVAVIDIIFAAPVYNLSALYIIVAVLIYVVVVIVIDGIFATFVRWLLPQKWFGVDKAFFAASKRTCRFYEKIGVKKWKDKILELGMFTAFSKSKIADPTNNEYIARYIMEANYGIAVHFSGIVFGFLIMVIYPPYWLIFGLPVSIVNAVYNYLSFVILRYNLPKLHTLYKFNERRRKAQEEKQRDIA